jgi:hypothetical protein
MEKTKMAKTVYIAMKLRMMASGAIPHLREHPKK